MDKIKKSLFGTLLLILANNSYSDNYVEKNQILNPFYPETSKVIQAKEEFKKTAINVLIREHEKITDSCYLYKKHESISKEEDVFFEIIYCKSGKPFPITPGSKIFIGYMQTKNNDIIESYNYKYFLNSNYHVEILSAMESNLKEISYKKIQDTIAKTSNLHQVYKKDIVRKLDDFKEE